MKELENLKELYLEEIKKINKKGELTPVDAEAAKKALEAIEKIDEICCDEEKDMGYSETGYSNRRSYGRMNGYYNDGRSYGNGQYMVEGRYVSGRMPEMNPSYGYGDGYQMMHPMDYPYYNDGYSERRGRSATTGRYISRHNGSSVDKMIHKLENMKSEAPDSETMMAIDNVIRKLEDY